MKRTKAAARSRRIDPLPGVAFNLEVLGIALLCVTLVLTLSMLLPYRQSGSVGPLIDRTLHGWFGGAAWIVPLALATIAVILFLEMHAPRLMLLLALCAAGEFFVIDALFGMGKHGGVVGGALSGLLVWLFGRLATGVILLCGAVIFVLAPTGVSLKRALSSIAAALPAMLEKSRQMGRERMPVIRPHNASIAEAPTRHTNQLEAASPATPPLAAGDQSPQVAPEHVEVNPEDEPSFNAPPAQTQAFPVALEPAATPVHLERVPPLRFDDGRPALKSANRMTYRLPDFALFNPPEKRVHNESSAALLLQETLASFGVAAEVSHIERGPSVTRYEMTPARGVKVSAIKSLSDNIQLALAAQSIRIEAPIPGKAAVGIEVPNSAVSIVAIREILDYLPKGEGKLSIGLGKDISGRPIIADLGRMPHLLVAGATGAGKSVCLNAILASLLSTSTPDQVQLLLIDPKRVELTSYNGVPHLIKDCITDAKLAAGALFELTKEMDVRYERFARAGVRKIEEYNHQHPDERLPYIVVAIDELADLMLVAPTRVETSICRIAQLARATGIHLVVATQRPSVDVITGLIKANIPSRIAFAVSSQVDSRTILDMAGAERLLGRGDMLYLPIDAPKPVRVQGALVSGDEIERLCEFWRQQEDPQNRIDIELTQVQEDVSGPSDELAYEAAIIIVERQMASVALLQAELKVGHPRAVRLIKILEEYRVVGPSEGTKPRKIMVGEADMEQLATILTPRWKEQTLL